MAAMNAPESRLIRQWRKLYDVTQEDLAARLQVDRRTVQRWESGESIPPSRQLVTMLQSVYDAQDF